MIELVIIGKGPLEKKLKEYTKVLKIERNVHFLGFEKKNPYRILANAKIFLFTSLHEGFGNVLIEAMACGVPVISTNCLYGPLEIIHTTTKYIRKRKKTIFGKYGILTPAFSRSEKRGESIYEEKEMAKAIYTLLGSSELQKKYRILSKKRAKDFTVQKMVQEYCKVISELV
jgi:N-acetylgalactosamine-N,N'-diacetylbacillosaminyl-diphospho-undecaprenol 4-alpha-N-acetylgalactosaminyltransferase